MYGTISHILSNNISDHIFDHRIGVIATFIVNTASQDDIAPVSKQVHNHLVKAVSSVKEYLEKAGYTLLPLALILVRYNFTS